MQSIIDTGNNNASTYAIRFLIWLDPSKGLTETCAFVAGTMVIVNFCFFVCEVSGVVLKKYRLKKHDRIMRVIN